MTMRDETLGPWDPLGWGVLMCHGSAIDRNFGKSIENSECPYDRHIPFDIPYRIPGMIEKSGCDLMIRFCSSDFPVPRQVLSSNDGGWM